MKKLMICSMVCLMAMASKAQVMTSALVNKVYEEMRMDSSSQFAYHAEFDDNGNVSSMSVYQKCQGKDRNHLKPVCRYQYNYHADGLLSSRIKYVWQHNDWQCFGRYDYTLTGAIYTAEFSRWNQQKSAFSQPQGKMIYLLQPNDSVTLIACYSRHHKNSPMELDLQISVEYQPLCTDNDLANK
jgi:Tfp pilus assembly protein PilV